VGGERVLVLIWLVLMVGAFYLLLWRPQQRRAMAVRELQGSLAEGDEVVTTSGIFGRVRRLEDEIVDLEIAPGTTIRIARGAIGQRITGEPADDSGEGA
jgi:preprotein translocase subunit YajC